MRVLQVIHGYPPRYNAGSEVYTQMLSQALVKAGHQVEIFTREEDSTRPDYEMRLDHDSVDERIKTHLINMPNTRDRFSNPAVDHKFDSVVDEYGPDVIHIEHLNHLSTSIIKVASDRNLPLVYTLHDYWLMCPRGQFVQTNLGGAAWKLCDGQEDQKCAQSCYSRYFAGLPDTEESDVAYWTAWVRSRMSHVHEMTRYVDFFVAPSEYLEKRFIDEFGLPANKVTYLDYGFDLKRLSGRRRKREDGFVFGYIGTHLIPKGINVLVEAFGQVKGNTKLRVWGRDNSVVTPFLRSLASSLPYGRSESIEWLGEYRNDNIVDQVFNQVDAIVVPSIWVENSPLVIHEAQQVGVPVITSNLGGMAEYISDGVNGLLFDPRNSADLAAKMQRFVDDPALASSLGRRGYLKSQRGQIPDIERHCRQMVSVYELALKRRLSSA
jgi:glycosyltransferase involved in cell wall biosynthesis